MSQIFDSNFAALVEAIKDARCHPIAVPVVGVCGVMGSGKTTAARRLGDSVEGLPVFHGNTLDGTPVATGNISLPSVVTLDELFGTEGSARATSVRASLPSGSVLVLLTQDAGVFPDDAAVLQFNC